MPGILPMKVIRVGSSAQSRIAQACDRCRSKKIRCDGIRPCCTQCGNVGFECKTSDKLSRRAFPRGYTESLEDRVRGLEAEVRELKDLLDEKDEKLEMLSKIHSFSPSSRKSSSSSSPVASEQGNEDLQATKEDCIRIEPPMSADPTTSLPGLSSTAAFIGKKTTLRVTTWPMLIRSSDSFDQKVQDFNRPCPEVRTTNLLQHSQSNSVWPTSPKGLSKIPPRLLSDQFINIFFQEWAPLLPVLHRPSFLKIYEAYLADPEASHWHSNKQAIAQLFLIFDIAALSSVVSTNSFETLTYG